MKTDFIRTETAPFYQRETDRVPARELLWGDRVTFDDSVPAASERVRARARGVEGFVKRSDLGGEALLEVYFIDVGQGDGVLIVTPDERLVLIDGGFKRRAQPTGKNAADFVDWKCVKDLGRPGIELDAMISSHNDADHYGGLWDLLNPKERAELNATHVSVKRFLTAGVSWFSAPGKSRFLGRVLREGNAAFLRDLLSGREDALRWLSTSSKQRLQGEWGDFIQAVVDHGCPIQRLSDKTGFVPGYGPDSTDPTRLRVLGPVESSVGGESVLRSLGSDSQNTNGNSVLLRLDYRRSRILLTGDLNAASQALLMKNHPEGPGEFAADVVKACHHGSDECSLAFLQAIKAAATVISSGDSEGFSHPRPAIVAASGLTGHVTVKKDRLVTPLIYSTELARSYRLGRVLEILDDGKRPVDGSAKYRGRYSETDPGALRPRIRDRRLIGSDLVSGIVYGLVNVRTDGRRILCATLNENRRVWDVRSFESRF